MKWWIIPLSILALSSCTRETPQAVSTLVDRHGCGGCHVIPGIPGATGRTGPPLGDYSRQVYVAGVSPNTPDILSRFIMNPRAIDPRSAMPNLGVSAAEARLLASYLRGDQ